MILHILNGDSTLDIMQNLDIKGEFSVWREVMCEGPVHGDLQSTTFWERRANFIADFFHTESSSYFEKLNPELDKIRNANQYEEVVLWFEYDLFCQINLLAALHFLNNLPQQAQKISLVCVGNWPGHQEKLTLGEIDPKHYDRLLETRQVLDSNALTFADHAWQLYAHENAEVLNDADHFKHPNFPYLAEAIQLHKRRFPSRKNGLNVIETSLLEQIKAGESNKRKLVGHSLREFRNEGFGDAQYFTYLEYLAPLLENQEDLILNDFGERVLAGEERFLSSQIYIGDAQHTAYYWNEERIYSAGQSLN